MIKVLFFAKTKEQVGEGELQLPLDESMKSVNDIRLQLVERGDNFKQALSSEKLLVAVNQSMVPMSSEVKSGDEVAFFPPVTGG